MSETETKRACAACGFPVEPGGHYCDILNDWVLLPPDNSLSDERPFSREDVVMLRQAAAEPTGMSSELKALASRIEALLPPE